MPLLAQYKFLFEDNPHMQAVLVHIYEDILSFHTRALCFFSGKGMYYLLTSSYPRWRSADLPQVWRQIFRSLWKNFESRFRSILQALSRHRELIAEQAGLLHHQQYRHDMQAMLRHIQQYQHDREKSIENDQAREEADAQRKRREVLQWFSAAETIRFDQENYSATRRQYSGTGDWILENEKVKNWIEEDTPISSILWMSGKPGAGMSVT